MRVVSLLPSATEIVAALGHASELVGRSHECDYPPFILDRAVVMRPKVDDFERPSEEIDERVRAARGRGESLYELDVARLRSLQPDLLLTQELCGVCSVTGEEVAAACRAAGIDPRIVSLTPKTLADVWGSIRTVGEALGDADAADLLLKSLERRTRPRVPPPNRPTVLIVEWLTPPILAGLWVAEMVVDAGGRSLGPPSSTPGVRTTWERIEAVSPDLLVLSPCSFSVDRARREIDHARLGSTLAKLHPAQGIWLADEAYFSRPGPRLADGVELLRSWLLSEPYTPPMPARAWTAAET